MASGMNWGRVTRNSVKDVDTDATQVKEVFDPNNSKNDDKNDENNETRENLSEDNESMEDDEQVA